MSQKGFYNQVYDVVARIPSGRVATFGQIATLIGRPRMARFVGYASNNQKSWHLPWHLKKFLSKLFIEEASSNSLFSCSLSLVLFSVGFSLSISKLSEFISF